MPVQKMINVLKILFIALSAMFMLLYISLTNRQANAEAIANANVFVDSKSLLANVSLSPVMALIPMILCAAFTVFLFIAGYKEKKKEIQIDVDNAKGDKSNDNDINDNNANENENIE